MKAAVLIPVYNAFDEALECLQSVASHSPGVRVLVLDDASPGGNFVDHVPESLYQELELKIIRNETNLGFPANCNRGFELLSPADVVILNSDTVVTNQWLEKLHQAAMSDATVGTVTPLTNNGDLCSVPCFRENNQVPVGHTLDSVAQLVERVSEREYPKMPTCTGHCVYIKRVLLDAIGGFDAITFGAGYGEENDFSCRAQKAGFIDILDDATFIYHKGEASFSERSELLRRNNFELLSKKHKFYPDTVARFIAKNPLRGIQQRIKFELVREYVSTKSGLVLHILHNGPYRSYGDPLGGTERHVRELIKGVTEFAHCSLVATQSELWFGLHHPDFDCYLCLKPAAEFFERIFQGGFLSHVHLHHSRWFNHHELLSQLAESPSYCISLHDFVLGCPRFHLLTPKGDLCNRHECVKSCGYEAAFISSYRELSSKALNSAAKVFAFSKSSEELLRQMVSGEWKVTPIAHGVASELSPVIREEPPEFSQVIKVLILGGLTYHKGAEIYRELFRHRRLFNGVKIEWHVLGDARLKSGSPNGFFHGEYLLEELGAKVAEINPHLALFLSLAPETYSLAVDEVLQCKIPVVVSPRGAPAERVADFCLGWIVPELSEGAVLQLLSQIQSNRQQYLEISKQVLAHEPPSIIKQLELYSEHYLNAQSQRPEGFPSLMALLADFKAPEPVRAGAPTRAVGRIVTSSIHLLDSFGVRRRIQSAVERIAPDRVVKRLKQARRDSFLK